MRFDKIMQVAVSLIVALVVLGLLTNKVWLGVFPFGPRTVQQVRVTRLYVDYSGSGDSRSSHYMVGTDSGVFEVDNSLWIWMWDADRVYAKLQEGKSYTVNVKGTELVTFFAQEYPHITDAVEIK